MATPADGDRTLGWIISSDGEERQPFGLMPGDRSRHLYLLGATGSGKTNLILNLLNQDTAASRTLIVVDLRGDLVDRILVQLAASSPEMVSRVRLLDLREGERILGFNPLKGAGDPHARAYMVLDALRSQSESWGVQLEETLRNALIAISLNSGCLLDIEPLLTQADFRARLLERAPDPAVALFFARYNALSPEKQQAWFLPVLNKVTPLIGLPRLRGLFGAASSIDLRQIIDTPGQVLLISLAVDRLHSAAKLVGSLLIGAIQTAVMARVDQPENRRNPVSLYIDEFETMATEAFASIIAEGRRFRLSLTLSHQNLSQIPISLRQVVRNNVGIQVFFQTGSLDAHELKHQLAFGPDDDPIPLPKLRVGQAYLVRRPDDPALVEFKRYVEPQVSAPTVSDFLTRVHNNQGSVPAIKCESRMPQTRPVKSETGRGQAVRHERVPKRSQEESP